MKKKPRPRPKRKNPVLRDVFELYRGDPVVASATLDFFTAFVRLAQAVEAHGGFTPASEEDRVRPTRETRWVDPRRTAARRPRGDDDDEEEEEAE